MNDLSEISFSGDAPPERFASPSPSRQQLFGRKGGGPGARWPRLSARGWAIAIALVLVGGIVAAYLALREAPVFPLEKVALDGKTRLTAEEALGLSGLSRGDNLLSADLAGAAERIRKALSFVRAATVERELPGTLRIRVEERTPTLLVAMQHLYVADERGELFQRHPAGEKPSVPILTGLSREDGQKRKKHVASVVVEALELVRAIEGRCTEEISFDAVLGYSVHLCAGPWVRFGRSPFVGRAGQLERALGASKRTKLILLDDEKRPDRVVVRVGEGEGV